MKFLTFALDNIHFKVFNEYIDLTFKYQVNSLFLGSERYV